MRIVTSSCVVQVGFLLWLDCGTCRLHLVGFALVFLPANMPSVEIPWRFLGAFSQELALCRGGVGSVEEEEWKFQLRVPAALWLCPKQIFGVGGGRAQRER